VWWTPLLESSSSDSLKILTLHSHTCYFYRFFFSYINIIFIDGEIVSTSENLTRTTQQRIYQSVIEFWRFKRGLISDSYLWKILNWKWKIHCVCSTTYNTVKKKICPNFLSKWFNYYGVHLCMYIRYYIEYIITTITIGPSQWFIVIFQKL
jgi:hypothetical protein